MEIKIFNLTTVTINPMDLTPDAVKPVTKTIVGESDAREQFCYAVNYPNVYDDDNSGFEISLYDIEGYKTDMTINESSSTYDHVRGRDNFTVQFSKFTHIKTAYVCLKNKEGVIVTIGLSE